MRWKVSWMLDYIILQDRGEKVLVKGREAAEKLDEAKGSVKETADKSEEKAKSVIDSATEHTKKEMHTAGEMVRTFVHKSAIRA